MASTFNPHKALHQRKRANEFTRFCREHDITFFTALEYGEEQWRLVAGELKIKPPSAETVALVLGELLRDDERMSVEYLRQVCGKAFVHAIDVTTQEQNQ